MGRKKRDSDGPIRQKLLAGYKVFAIDVLGDWTVIVKGGNNLKKILVGGEKYTTVEMFTSTRLLMGQHSLTTQNGIKHASRRRLINKTFTPTALSEYAPMVIAMTERYVENMIHASGPVLGHREMKNFTFDVMSKSLLGLDFNDGNYDQLRASFDAWLQGLFTLAVDIPYSPYNKALEAKRYIHAAIDKAIEQKQKRRAQAIADSATETATATPHHDLLEMLMTADDPETGESMTTEEIREQVLLLLFAGRDTTSTMLTLLLYCLDRNADAKQKARDEQAEIQRRYHGLNPTDNTEESLSLKALNEMKYLEGVIQEGLRLYTPAPGVFRRATTTFELDGGNGTTVQIPKGTKLQCNILRTHEDADYVDKKSFRPERWVVPIENPTSNEKEADTSPSVSKCPMTGLFPADGQGKQRTFDHCPFGGGKRKCIGFPLAMWEMKIFLATLLRKVDWELDDPECEWGLVPLPYPKDGLKMRVTSL